MHSLSYKDFKIKYLDEGDGETILFLHNAGISHRLWDFQIDAFKNRFRVVAPDLLGYGESDRPDIIYSAEDYLAQIEKLVSSLDIKKFHLVGCCLGGAISLKFAQRHPEKLLSLAVITATTPSTISSGLLGPLESIAKPGSSLRNFMWKVTENKLGRAIMSELFCRHQCGKEALKDSDFKSHVKSMYQTPGQWRVFTNTDYSGFVSLENFEKPRAFPPTLIMWGGKNSILRSNAGENLKNNVNPERSEFWSENGYMLMRERSDETNSVLKEHFEKSKEAVYSY